MADNILINYYSMAKAMDLNLSIKMVNSITLGPIVNSLPMKLAGISRSKTHIPLIPLNSTKQTPGQNAHH